MKVTYIGHSGFLVELEHCYLLFDYYQGAIPVLNREKSLYIFVSHHHGDHFNPQIFQLKTACNKVHYILANDVRISSAKGMRFGLKESFAEKVTAAKARETISLDDLTIRTLRSTDEGVAFLVEAEGRTIYHAGDLNWWYWEGEDHGWNKQMTRNFKEELDLWKGIEIELAFLPLDDRQGASYDKGMDWYLRTWKIRNAFPMHFWEDKGVVARFCAREESREFQTVIFDTASEKEWVIR
ncbi:MAG: MBL fold metallo-hydrolase [Lachnospiraceae bacterium]|nr:MBL fold metallo-hydrolase [Lachnospiraceae bacterium]